MTKRSTSSDVSRCFERWPRSLTDTRPHAPELTAMDECVLETLGFCNCSACRSGAADPEIAVTYSPPPGCGEDRSCHADDQADNAVCAACKRSFADRAARLSHIKAVAGRVKAKGKNKRLREMDEQFIRAHVNELNALSIDHAGVKPKERSQRQKI